MESLQHNCGNNLLTICTITLIYSKDTFFSLDHLDDLKFTNSNFCDVKLRHSIVNITLDMRGRGKQSVVLIADTTV